MNSGESRKLYVFGQIRSGPANLTSAIVNFKLKMQKRNHKKSKSSAQRIETIDHSEDSASPTSSPSDRHERKRVRWEGKSAAEDSADTDSEDEIESPEKV